MHRTAASLAAIAILTLTGCASTAAPEAVETATPTPTPAPNATACPDFAEATTRLADSLSGDGTWEALRDDMDAIALRADGDVKERINTLVSTWPKASDIVVYREFSDINQAVSDVSRACDAQGYPVDAQRFAE